MGIILVKQIVGKTQHEIIRKWKQFKNGQIDFKFETIPETHTF